MSNIGLFLIENILGIKIDLIFLCKINIKCLFHNKIHINYPIIYQKILFKMLVPRVNCRKWGGYSNYIFLGNGIVAALHASYSLKFVGN